MLQFVIHRPLLRFAVCFLLGTGIGLAGTIPASAASCAALVTIAIAILLSRRTKRTASTTVLGTILLHTGWVFLAAAIASAHPRTQEAWTPPAADSITAGGIVISDPDIRPAIRGQVHQFTLLVDSCAVGRPIPVDRKGRLRISLYSGGWSRGPSYGERWEFKGEPKASGHTGISYMNVSWRNARFISTGHGSQLKRRAYETRHAAASYLELGIGDYEEASSILQAVLLGYRGRLSREARDLFIATGTLHIFAISGLHVGMIALFATFFLRLLRISRVHWVLLIGPLLLAYTLATGARPSAVRACIMAIIYFLAPLLGRKTDESSGLAAAAILIVLWDPLQLMDIGFIYSFAVVAGISLLYPLLGSLFSCLSEPDPLVERTKSPCRALLRYLAGITMISMAAWLSSAPLTAWYFGRFAPVALLSNIVVVPMTLTVVFVGCLCLLLGPCASFIAVALNYINVVLISILTTLIRGLARIPGLSIEIARPSVWLLICWYLLLICLVFAGIRKARSRKIACTQQAP